MIACLLIYSQSGEKYFCAFMLALMHDDYFSYFNSAFMSNDSDFVFISIRTFQLISYRKD